MSAKSEPTKSKFLEANFYSGRRYEKNARDIHALEQRLTGNGQFSDVCTFSYNINARIDDHLSDPYLPLTSGGFDLFKPEFTTTQSWHFVSKSREMDGELIERDYKRAFNEEANYRYLESIYGPRYGKEFQEVLYKAKCFNHHMCDSKYEINPLLKALRTFKTKEEKKILPMIVEFFKSLGKNKIRNLLKALKALEAETGEKHAVLKRRLRDALKQESFPSIIEKPKLEGRPIEIRPPIQPNSPNPFY